MFPMLGIPLQYWEITFLKTSALRTAWDRRETLWEQEASQQEVGQGSDRWLEHMFDKWYYTHMWRFNKENHHFVQSVYTNNEGRNVT